jgi:hypothetical protein
METLRQIYESHQGRLLNKWDHYIDVYDKYFHEYRDKEIVFLEIGIAHGGSLQMWRRYFGEKAKIIAVDVNEECKKFAEPNTIIYIGSQEDENFLADLKSKIPKVDILLDDGGHTMSQQITTFKSLFTHVKEDGLYVCEDIHTSYWKDYYGGYKKKGTFIEFSKNFIDYIHGWHAEPKVKKDMFNYITESVYALHYYDSMLIMEKKPMTPPKNTFRGEKQLSDHFQGFGQRGEWRIKLRKWARSVIGKK